MKPYYVSDTVPGTSPKSIHSVLKGVLNVCVQPCLTLCDPTDCSPPGSSVYGIFQARMLQSVAISSRIWEMWEIGSERLFKFPKVTQLVISRIRIGN